MTTASILTLARAKILEATDAIVSDATLYIYGSLTQQDIAIRAFPNSSVLTATVNFVNGVAAKPASFGTLYGDAYEDAYNVYPEMSILDFVRNTDQNAIAVDGANLKIYPALSKTLTVRYWPTYLDLSVSQNPTIDSYFHELIIYGILYRALEDLQDEELSKYYRDKYESEFKLKREALSQYEENNVRGGQMFHPIQVISDDHGGGGDPNHW